jgi:hypothetical protein
MNKEIKTLSIGETLSTGETLIAYTDLDDYNSSTVNIAVFSGSCFEWSSKKAQTAMIKGIIKQLETLLDDNVKNIQTD